MERVVHAQPVDGEISVSAEVSVSEKRGAQIAEFDEETIFQDRFGEMFQHEPEQVFLFQGFVKIFPVAEYLASLDDGRRKEARAPSDNRQKLGYRAFFFRGDDEDRGISGCLFVDVEQLGGVGKRASRQRWNDASFLVCRQSDAHISLQNYAFLFMNSYSNRIFVRI
jgi:hypothetical protein